jgi:hypothetical protein
MISEDNIYVIKAGDKDYRVARVYNGSQLDNYSKDSEFWKSTIRLLFPKLGYTNKTDALMAAHELADTLMSENPKFQLGVFYKGDYSDAFN